MAANDPRVEFRPSTALRDKLETYREEMSKKAGKRVSLSKVVAAILEEFFELPRD